MDGAALFIDLAKLATDAAGGANELALAKDVAEALLHQVGPEKLRELGAYFIAHASAHIEVEDAYPIQSDEPTGSGQPMTGDAGDADPHSGP